MIKFNSFLVLSVLVLSSCGSSTTTTGGPAPASNEEAQAVQSPVTCDIYDLGSYPAALPTFSNLTPAHTVGLSKLSLGRAVGDATPFPALVGTPAESLVHNVAFRCMGALVVTSSGVNILSVKSDDGVRITVAGLKVLERNNNHGVVTDNVSLTLNAGTYPIMVEYFQGNGDKELNISLQGPAQSL